MKNKEIGFIIFLLTLTSSAFGQQLLWSTIEKDSLKELSQYVPLSNETFLNSMPGGFELDEKNKLDDINESTVIAVRTNFGQGSVVFVICVSKTNVNAIIFSNSSIVSGMDFRLTYSSDSEREKFTKWFKTLLN